MFSKRPVERGSAEEGGARPSPPKHFHFDKPEPVHPGGRNPAMAPRETPHPGMTFSVPHFSAREELAKLVRRRVELRRKEAEARALLAAKLERRAAVAEVLRHLIIGGAGGECGMSWKEGLKTASIIVDATGITPEPAISSPAAAAAALPGEDGRPAWARSSSEEESREDRECTEILDFAARLNADQYLQSLEVSACRPYYRHHTLAHTRTTHLQLHPPNARRPNILFLGGERTTRD